MVALVALIIWRLSAFIVVPIFALFLVLDGVYLSAALQKVPEGGWFALVLAAILSSIFILWRWGKEKQWISEAKDRTIPSIFLDLSKATPKNHRDSQHTSNVAIDLVGSGGDILTIPGVGLFFDKVGGNGDHMPKVFTHFLRRFRSQPRVTVFFHLRPLNQPHVPRDEQFVITRVNSNLISSCYCVTLRHGYADHVLTPELSRQVIIELALFITRGAPEVKPDDVPPQIRGEMTVLQAAEQEQVLYIMGKQVIRIRKRDRRNPLRRAALEVFLWIRDISRRKLANLDIDPDSLVEVGFVKTI